MNQQELTKLLTTPKVNVAMLKEVMSLVEQAAEKKMWVQQEWLTQEPNYLKVAEGPLVYNGQEFCGTAGCFAGWTVMLDGWKPEMHQPFPEDPDYWELLIIKGSEKHIAGDAEYIAQEILGLTVDETDELFDGYNTLEDLRMIVKRIIADAEADEQ